MADVADQADTVYYQLDRFVDLAAGVTDAVLVSADGLAMAASRGMDRDGADRFAAVASGLIGLAYGAAGRFGGGAVHEVVIEMQHAFIFVTGITDGWCLAVVAISKCDLEVVGYEMAVLGEQLRPALTPGVREALRTAVLR